MTNYFTSDWHFGEDRLGIDGKPNLFYRPFSSTQEQNQIIVQNFLNSGFVDGDTLWNLGDVLYKNDDQEEDFIGLLRNMYPKSEFNLVVGNYDEDKLDVLGKYFDAIWKDGGYIHLQDSRYSDPFLKVGLNHYPAECLKRMESEVVTLGNKPTSFYLTGHIHSLWKVQPKMINVGVDAWNFAPVSEKQILFCWNAMNKHYDKNVFPYTWNK